MANQVTYQSVLDELNAFSLSDATNRDDAMERVSNFMDEIRPKIDQVLRENPNLTAEEKREFDKGEKRIFNELDTQFAQGGRRHKRSGRKTRRTRRARKGRKAHKKSRRNRRN
jgi:hypothetical protein